MSEYEFIPAAAPNFMRGRGGSSVEMVILHTTVGSMAATIGTFQNPGRIASAHYVVGLDGRVVQMVFEWNTAYHAGNFSVNERSVGIEHVDNGNYNGPRTPALYDASIQLVAEICHRNGIPIDRAHIRKHKEVSDNPTACPDALDVDRIVNGAANLKFSGGSGSLEGADMTPEQDQKLTALFNVYVSRQKPIPTEPTSNAGETMLDRFTRWNGELNALAALPTANNAAVLAAIADLKAHPSAVSDPTLAGKIDALVGEIGALGKHLGQGTA